MRTMERIVNTEIPNDFVSRCQIRNSLNKFVFMHS